MTTLHMETENVRATARGMAQSGEQIALSIQALTRSVQALRSTWEGGDSEEFGIEAQNLVRQLDEQANLFIALAGRVDREVSEWEETDQRGAGDWQGVVSSGGGPFGASAGVLGLSTGATIASLIAGLPAWLKSFLDRFFPPTVPPRVEQTTKPASTKDGFAEIIEKAKKEDEAKKQAEAECKNEAEAPKPKYINNYPARPDDGTYLVGQETGDSCALASTKMALQRAAGIDAKESDLRTASHKLPNGYENGNYTGTYIDSCDDLVNNQYGDKVVATYKDYGTQKIDNLEHAANDGEGIVVSVRMSEWMGGPKNHFVTVVGVETVCGKQVVLINDPWPKNAGKRLAVPVDDFNRAWFGDAMYVSKK